MVSSKEFKAALLCIMAFALGLLIACTSGCAVGFQVEAGLHSQRRFCPDGLGQKHDHTPRTIRKDIP